MTTKDSTDDKLVAPTNSRKAGSAAKTEDQAAAKVAPRRQPMSKGGKTEAQLAAVTKRGASRDAYQSLGRVWPD